MYNVVFMYMFSELTIWNETTNWYALPWETISSIPLLPVVLCAELRPSGIIFHSTLVLSLSAHV